jgi:hypothetical protein
VTFQKQPGFCCVCGKAGKFAPHMHRGFICEERECHEEYHWRYTLYTLGKEYYPRPEKRDE